MARAIHQQPVLRLLHATEPALCPTEPSEPPSSHPPATLPPYIISTRVSCIATSSRGDDRNGSSFAQIPIAASGLHICCPESIPE